MHETQDFTVRRLGATSNGIGQGGGGLTNARQNLGDLWCLYRI